VRIVHAWLLSELVEIPGDVEAVAHAIALCGFEVASIETAPHAVIDFEVTANRPDCLSHLGFAREASVIWRTPLVQAAATPPGVPGGAVVPVEVHEPDLCPRYCAQLFEVAIAVAATGWRTGSRRPASVRSTTSSTSPTT
jgi:phenylalanyl-tRNA synthetase beta chain